MAEFLEDDDSSGMGDHHFGHQEWDRLEENFVNAGYREGITAGKEEALQEGFDEGFADYGAPSGRDIGTLRGVAAGLLFFLHNLDDPSDSLNKDEGIEKITDTEERVQQREEAHKIVSELATMKLTDLLPPDLEALEHAKDHADADGRGAAVRDANTEMEEVTKKWEDAKTKIGDLRTRINALAAGLKLNISV